MKNFPSTRRKLFLLLSIALLSSNAKLYTPPDLGQYKTSQSLAEASRKSYEATRSATQKKDKLQFSQAGIAYATRCLKDDPKNVDCLYYHVLNRGQYIKVHFSKYQKSLKLMVQDCETVIQLKPDYADAGCYRVLGNIYAKVPSFTMTSKGITRDLDKSVEYLQKATEIAPKYSLNHLYLARSLEENGQDELAKKSLRTFQSLNHQGLEADFADWRKERDKLAQKLHVSLQENKPTQAKEKSWPVSTK